MSIQTTDVACTMKMFSMVFYLVVLPLWLPLWSILSSFYMSPHCDFASHSTCNICQSSLYYFMFLLVLHVWYSMVLKVHSLLLQNHAFFTQHRRLLMLL
jgi:hypothetical protein